MDKDTQNTTAKKEILMDMVHLVNFGLAINNLNGRINDIQMEYFNQANVDPSRYRPLYSPYTNGHDFLRFLLDKLKLESYKEIYKLFSEPFASETVLISPQEGEYIRTETISALKQCRQRTCFFLLAPDEQQEFERVMGLESAKMMHLEVNALLHNDMLTGSFDNSRDNVLKYLNITIKEFYSWEL